MIVPLSLALHVTNETAIYDVEHLFAQPTSSAQAFRDVRVWEFTNARKEVRDDT